MSLSNDKLWQEDIDKILSDIDLSSLAGHKVMVTGCTGLICSAVVDTLIRWNCTHDEKIRIHAVARNVEAVKERFEPYSGEPWFEADQYDAMKSINTLKPDCDYIIHGAGNASPSNIVREPVETMIANIYGLKNLLDYSRKNGTKRLLYISSSEVYGRRSGTADDERADKPFTTNDYGFIDILDPRSSYSSSKRAGETLCVSYADEYGVDSVIVRPGHVYGPTAKESDNRVSSVWAYAVARGQDIVMKSGGAQIRSYCYAADAVSAILKVLIDGQMSHAYNISNSASVINIKELAELMAGAGGVKIKYDLPNEAEKKGFNPMPNSSLDAKELMGLGWEGKFDAKEGIEHTIRILQEIIEP